MTQGCVDDGKRASDLFMFEINADTNDDGVWTCLDRGGKGDAGDEDAPLAAGGAALVAQKNAVFVFFGFNGGEDRLCLACWHRSHFALTAPIARVHRFDLATRSWTRIAFDTAVAPQRSVFGCAKSGDGASVVITCGEVEV
jgi:hypothetical protein